MNNAIIKVENLSKNYFVSKRDKGMKGSIKGLFRRNHVLIEALKDISFSVYEGECIGFVGPNGAGKSTTLKILSGILTPTSGSCTILDRTPWKQRIEHVKHIGVVFGQRTQLWWDLPLQESFDLLKMVYSIPTHDFQRGLRFLIDLLHMGPWLSVPVRQLSLGLRMRADLIASLLHNPDLLLLDEPSIGLDTETKCDLRSFLKQLNTKKGKTILLASHDLWDVEALCTRMLFINHGCILRDTTLKAFLSEDISERSIKLKGVSKLTLMQFFPSYLIEEQGESLCLTIDTRKISLKEILTSLSSMEGIEELIIEQPGIEEIVLKLYKETKNYD
jgi:ABC-2 type transport system ATP-binding protein